ncbi:hypothetical protein H6P81_003168 [Aristolochia fimbriata]|uniref:Uncharacterized protein n=1 Tax=Aristolochia fimbriata TaxID=158543 RepID=A0AAV7FBS7_ARIFI|nr:hypothetical protein H6P81_003168 [Aristolochia fimbriata]
MEFSFVTRQFFPLQATGGGNCCSNPLATTPVSAGEGATSVDEARADKRPTSPDYIVSWYNDRRELKVGDVATIKISFLEGNDEASLGVRVASSMLKFYKREISPLLPASCRLLIPVESYSKQAVRKIPVLCVIDDGHDMSHSDIVRMLSFGHKQSDECNRDYIGRFGIGFKVLEAPYGDLLSCMEMAKVADLIAFVASASAIHDDDYIDEFGSRCLSVFRAPGFPSTAVLMRDLPADTKKRHDLKKSCTLSLASHFPEDCKFYPVDTKNELHKCNCGSSNCGANTSESCKKNNFLWFFFKSVSSFICRHFASLSSCGMPIVV